MNTVAIATPATEVKTILAMMQQYCLKINMLRWSELSESNLCREIKEFNRRWDLIGDNVQHQCFKFADGLSTKNQPKMRAAVSNMQDIELNSVLFVFGLDLELSENKTMRSRAIQSTIKEVA